MGPHREREKISDSSGMRTQNPKNQNRLLLLNQLNYTARWELVMGNKDAN